MEPIKDPITQDEISRGMKMDAQGRWFTGNLLTQERVRGHLQLPKRVTINEDTLREGRQTPGVNVSEEDRLRVAAKLLEAGFEEMTVGYAASPHDRAFAKRISTQFPDARFSMHLKAQEKDWKAEVDRAVESGIKVAFIEMMAGVERARAPWFSREEIPERSYQVVERLHQQNPDLIVSFALISPHRSDPRLVEAAYRAAAEAKAERLYVCDAITLTPEAARFMTQWLRDIGGPQVQIAAHCHDDFGLSLPVCLAAVGAGAEIVDTCMNGLGDKSGICATEEFVACMEVLYQVPTGIRVDMLAQLSDMVEATYKIPKAPNKAVIGRNMFRHAVDGHIATFLQGEHWYAYECIKAESLGAQRHLEFGPMCVHTGEMGALAAKLRQMGYRYTADEIQAVSQHCMDGLQGRDHLSEQEVEDIIRTVLGAAS